MTRDDTVVTNALFSYFNFRDLRERERERQAGRQTEIGREGGGDKERTRSMCKHAQRLNVSSF